MLSLIRQSFTNLFVFKEVQRPWHMALLAACCVGLPMIIGLMAGNFRGGLLAGQAGLMILHLPAAPLKIRIRTLLRVSPAFLISFTLGLLFSFNEIIGMALFFVFVFLAHYTALYFRLRAPGSFFFIMLCAVSICQPFSPGTILVKLGFFSLGVCSTVILGTLYSLVTNPLVKPADEKNPAFLPEKNIVHVAITMSAFVGGSLFVARILQLENPYWVPVSCLAVMQGLSAVHARQRSFQRIMGTFIGLGVTWLLVSLNFNRVAIIGCIITLQFIVELVLARNYAVGILFVTPMAILLTEAALPSIRDPQGLILARLFDITIGSIIGLAGGWTMHHERFNKAHSSVQSGSKDL